MNAMNSQDGQCKRIQAYLESYLNNELLVETNHEVLKHIEGCENCAAALERGTRVKDALKRAVQRDVAPASLQERIQKQFRRRTLLVAPRMWALAVAAAMALAVGGLTMLQVRRGGNQSSQPSPDLMAVLNDQNAAVLKIGLGDHVHCALDSGLATEQFTEEEMAHRMGPDYVGLVSVVRTKLPEEYRIVVAHRCKFNRRKFVHLILRKDDAVLSLVITKKSGESFPKDSLAAVMNAAGIPIHQDRIAEQEVAGFETRDYLVFVASNLAEENNLLIASNLAPAVRDFLAKLEA